MSGRCTLQRPLLLGTLLAAMVTPSLAQQWVDTAASTTPAAPCTVQPAGIDWWASSPTAPAPAAAPTPITTLHFADNLRPSHPLADNEGVAAAALAGSALMLFGAWRWYRASRLPWPDPAFASPPPTSPHEEQETGDATGWRISRFDDLPQTAPVEELRPMRPLYESLDEDDVIDVEPVSLPS